MAASHSRASKIGREYLLCQYALPPIIPSAFTEAGSLFFVSPRRRQIPTEGYVSHFGNM
jgi:hypothetical protein